MGLSQTFQGGPLDLQNLIWQREANYSGGQFGFVNRAVTIQTDVSSGSSFEWNSLAQLNSHAKDGIPGHDGSSGENVGQYVQTNNDASHAKVWGQVVELGNKDPSHTTSAVVQELDAGGAVAVGVDLISFNGILDTGIRIGAGAGGHVSNGIEITADNPLLIHGLNPVMLILDPEQDVGLGAADGHLIGVSGWGQADMHAIVLV